MSIGKTTVYGYDTLGNITNYSELTIDDSLHAEIFYHDNDSLYIKNTPDSLRVFDGDTLIRLRANSVDSVGNISQIRKYLNSTIAAIFDFSYSDKGNLIKVLMPVNYTGEDRMEYDYVYDDEVEIYVDSIYDAFKYISNSKYDLRFGKLISSTDINGNSISYSLDSKGRIDTIIGPYDSLYTIAFEYFPFKDVPFAITRHFDAENQGDIETISFVDGLNRPLQVKKTGRLFINNTQADEDGFIVSGRKYFDEFGRDTSIYYPTWGAIDSATTFSVMNDSLAEPTRSFFDILNRKDSIQLPDNSTMKYNFSIADAPDGNSRHLTEIIDQNRHHKKLYNDVKERKWATVEQKTMVLGVGSIVNQFNYNAISELISATAGDSTTTFYNYDQLGRKISRIHPDTDTTLYFYDLADNLTHKLTANLKEVYGDTSGAIKYQYKFNRPSKIIYPKSFHNNVEYHYGTAQDSFNRVGRLYLQVDASGGQEFFYGPLGEVTKTIRTMLIDQENMLTFVTEFEYDTWNRLQRLIYPDGETLDYHYNRAGKLSSVSGVKKGVKYPYIERIEGYDEFEKRKFCEFGNGTRTFMIMKQIEEDWID